LLLNTPENLRALTYLADRRKELGFDNVLRFESGLQQGFGIDWPFISGQYSITVDGQWRVEQLAKYGPNVRYGTAPIPPPAGGREHAGWSNGNFMIIPAGARCPRGRGSSSSSGPG
jgi:multiple sugar transport system substrate-binding protein